MSPSAPLVNQDPPMSAQPTPAITAVGAPPPPTLLGEVAFGDQLRVKRWRLHNGLTLLGCLDTAAPVVSYHTWFRVGSRHEQVGKTGLAHLFEHLMFRETLHLPEGEFDRKLEEIGAENNAATWLDFTQYTISAPAARLPLVIELEAERMQHLVLREPQVQGEKSVVANERRFRVEDDVEGALSELLWATAFTRHSYRWPTIGWMQDIEGFTTEDCEAFYRTYYAPNNATLVVVGDFDEAQLLSLVTDCYGHLPAAALPLEDVYPEPPQGELRRLEVTKPTLTEKLLLGYHCPALGDVDHLPLSLLGEVLFGGRASRVVQRLVLQAELATDARIFVGTFKDPGLTEIFLSAREGHTAEELLAMLDEELERVQREPVTLEELERARARAELALLTSLETTDGKASTIGFYETVLGRPAAAFERLEALAQLGPSDLLRVARRWLPRDRRTLLLVRCSTEDGPGSTEAVEEPA